MAETTWQDVYPVIGEDGALAGIVTSDLLRVIATDASADWTIAADVMQPPVVVHLDDDLRAAAEVIVTNGLREVPVADGGGRIVAFLDEAEISRVYIEATRRLDPTASSTGLPRPEG
jgi:CBS domain-containing protein